MENIMNFRKYATTAGLGTQEILLWMHLYMTMERLGQWIDVPVETDDLMQELQLTRRTFYRVRQMLMNKGLISARKNKYHVLYTMHLQWTNVNALKACVDEDLVPAEEVPADDLEDNEGEMNPAETSQDNRPKSEYPEPEETVVPKDEKVLNLTKDQSYMEPLRLFCKGRSGVLHISLLNWAAMREMYHWDLTAEELRILLGNLNRLALETVRKERAAKGKGLSRYAKEDVDNTMVAIVEQSLKWRWKGFWPVDDYKWEAPDGNGPVTLQEMTMGFEKAPDQGTFTNLTDGGSRKNWHNESVKIAT